MKKQDLEALEVGQTISIETDCQKHVQRVKNYANMIKTKTGIKIKVSYKNGVLSAHRSGLPNRAEILESIRNLESGDTASFENPLSEVLSCLNFIGKNGYSVKVVVEVTRD